MQSPNAIGYDWNAQPNTIIVSEVADSVLVGVAAVYFINGTFFKRLTTNSADYPLQGPQTSTVDSRGYLYLAVAYANAVYVFSPYPNYQFLNSIPNITAPITLGITTVPTGEYLAVSNNYNILLFYINIKAANVSALLVTNTSSYHGYVYGGYFDPINGQLVYVESVANTTLHFYDVNYRSPTSVYLEFNHSFTKSNSALPNNSFPVSFQLDRSGHIIALSRYAGSDGRLGLVLLNPNGSSATEPTVTISIGISEVQAYVFMAIKPDGSVIYVPDPQNQSVTAFQGFMNNTEIRLGFDS